jgi:chromate reductase
MSKVEIERRAIAGSELDAEERAIETGKTVARPIRILGIFGSLRGNSYNKLLMIAASKLLPPSAQLEIFEINRIPLYNQDVEARGLPEEVKVFKAKIEAADALLISTPEYNHSYPGVLKNAIDWASRPYGHNSFDGKPVAVMSASPGVFGGIAAQDHLKQVLLALNTRLVTQPAVIVSSAQEKINQDGNLLDKNTEQFMRQLLTNLVNEARHFSQYDQTLVAPALQPIIADRLRREK